MKSAYYIAVGGQDVTGAFTEKATSISVTDASGKASDTASISLSDDNGSLLFPEIGDPITIGIGWGVPVVLFDGVIDDVDSSGGRGSGRAMEISAKSANVVASKLKQQSAKHKDKSTLGDVAAEWGKAAGINEMFVHPDLASIERDYWSMDNESFMAWGERIGQAYGATFKIFDTKAVLVPRSMGVSASGKVLLPVMAIYGENLRGWNIKPSLGRPQHSAFRTRHFDIGKGEWISEVEKAPYETKSDATMTTRYSEPHAAGGKAKAKSKAKESDRERGGGTIDIDGDPTAQSEAQCILTGARQGVDGAYRIDSVTHTRTRSGGFLTSLTVKQPTKKA